MYLSNYLQKPIYVEGCTVFKDIISLKHKEANNNFSSAHKKLIIWLTQNENFEKIYYPTYDIMNLMNTRNMYRKVKNHVLSLALIFATKLTNKQSKH